MKLIDKDALLAEIERRLRELSQLEKASYEIGLYDAYKIVLSFLDTLEVKEVDLEKEEYQISQSFDGEGLFDGSKVVLKAQKGEEV